MKILLASNNKDKLKEIKQILGAFCDIVTLKEAGIVSDPEETGKSFAENAFIKAKSGMEKSGMACLADDSGLCVDALNGAPGIFSARFAGEPCDNEKNNELLLEKLKNRENRAAKYVCAMCLVFPDGETLTTQGECEGIIMREYLGKNGFGYDPLFFVPEINKTFAQASAEEKNAMSHRAKALVKMEKLLSSRI